jgi:glycosyltransferase involved in cell wall biosynthesis
MENNKKNILIFSVAYYPFIGGAEVAWKEITDRIVDFEFDMITPRFSRSLPRFEKIRNINVHRIGVGNIIDKFLFPITGAIAGISLNHKRNYSLTVGIIFNHAGLAASFFKILKPKIPFLLNLQDGDTDEVIAKNTYGIKFITNKIYKKPDFVTVIAKFLKDRALKNGSTDKITLIPNGVDLNIFDAKIDKAELAKTKFDLKIKPDDKIIITTSRLNYKNAIDDLIKSLEFLSQNYKLLILGNGEDEEKLRQLTKEKALENNVVFLGYKSHNEVVRYLKISDIFCRPSLQEGLGNSFLEAMMAGVPIVATPVGGIPDFLKDGETGIFCKVKNPKSIAEKIKIICEDDKLRTAIIKKSRELIENNYNWSLIARNYTELFHKITRNE